jgi:parallel beta-helix repeat protein
MAMIQTRIKLSKNVLVLLCLLLIAGTTGNGEHATQTITYASESGIMSTNHTITIDANLSDWASDEILYGNDNVVWHITWDSSKLYIAVERGETFHGSSSDYDVVWVYLDTGETGSVNSVDWNGRHTLPLYAHWAFILRPWNKYWNLREWNNTDWKADCPYFGVEPAQDWYHGIAEIEIPFSDIGNPSSLGVVLYLTNGADNYLFGCTPTENPFGYNACLTKYWLYPHLTQNVSPNAPLISHGPLHINGNSDLVNLAQLYGWPGNGTPENPYLIEGYTFDGNGGGYAFWLENTDLHVLIKNCRIWNATSTYIFPYGAGLRLVSASNITVSHNLITSSKHAIELCGAMNVTIKHNTVTDSYFGIYFNTPASSNALVERNIVTKNNEGIVLYDGPIGEIIGNVISNNAIGISMSGARSNIVKGNEIYENYYHGMYLTGGSNLNDVRENRIYSNGNCGIVLDSSNSNQIVYNTISDNNGYGVSISGSSGNIVFANNFYRNNGAGKSANGSSQAYDDTGNSWDDGVNTGNYWSNWDETGTYPIDGSASAVDHFPQHTPIVHEHGPYYLWLIICLILIPILKRYIDKPPEI